MKMDFKLTGKRGISILDAGNQLLIIVVAVLLGYVAVKFFLPQQIVTESVAKQAAADQAETIVASQERSGLQIGSIEDQVGPPRNVVGAGRIALQSPGVVANVVADERQ